MDRILKILKKENAPRASSAPTLELNTIIFKHVYGYMQQISGERLQDHWSSGSYRNFSKNWNEQFKITLKDFHKESGPTPMIMLGIYRGPWIHTCDLSGKPKREI